jgi:hypothetical protein
MPFGSIPDTCCSQSAKLWVRLFAYQMWICEAKILENIRFRCAQIDITPAGLFTYLLNKQGPVLIDQATSLHQQ